MCVCVCVCACVCVCVCVCVSQYIWVDPTYKAVISHNNPYIIAFNLPSSGDFFMPRPHLHSARVLVLIFCFVIVLFLYCTSGLDRSDEISPYRAIMV